MKKFGKILITAGIIFCVYESGKIIGHLDCLKNVMTKYGKDIPDDEIVDNVSKIFTITLKKEKA